MKKTVNELKEIPMTQEKLDSDVAILMSKIKLFNQRITKRLEKIEKNYRGNK